MTWILGRLHFDTLFILLPGLLVFAVFFFWPLNEVSVAISAFLIASLLDSGHVYTTIWRIQLWKAALTLALSWAFVFLWMWSELPYFWSFFLYLTLFHHIRQYFGVQRWYQHLNQRRSSVSDNFLYLLTVTPVLLFHFRDDVNLHVFAPNDILMWPMPNVFRVGAFIYLGFWLLWFGYEAKTWAKGGHEWNRIASILCPSLLHGLCFLVGNNFVQVIFPVLAVHGLTYLALVSFSLQQIHPKRYNQWPKALIWVTATAIVFGSLEFLLEDAEQISMVEEGVLAALIVAPSVWHYAWDALIWKKSSPDGPLIYGDKRDYGSSCVLD